MRCDQMTESTRVGSGRADCPLRAVAAFTIACSLAFALLAALPQNAFADVRKADVVVGKTVEERGLSVSESPSVTADYAALISSDGTVYFSRKGDEQSQIASITKVMTAIVALENAPEGTEVAVSAAAAEIGESSAGLQEGDIMDLSTALKALLVPSGNDAAVALAETIGAAMSSSGDPVDAFVSAMNEKAASLGLTDTVYENPHGLDNDEYAGNLHSTALDQVKVAQCAMSFPEIREIVGGGSTTITVKRDGKGEDIELETTDLLLDMYESAIGIKTGVTDLAGPSFMGAANKDGRELYSVVLGSEDEYSRFQDSENLFEWAYEHVIDVPLANTAMSANMRVNGVSRDVPVVAEASHCEWIDRTVKATFKDPDATVNVFDLEGNVSQKIDLDEIHGTVDVGDKVGTATFYQGNVVVATQDLVACERVEAPNPIDTVAIWWQRTTQGLDGQTGRAPSRIYNVMPIIKDNSSNAA